MNLNMEMKKYKLGDIADINKQTLSKKDSMDVIEYLDTGSLTENIFGPKQVLSRKEAPSRAQRRVFDKTILYSTVRPRLKHYGFLESPKENTIVSTGFATIDVKDEFKNVIDARYLYLLLIQDKVTEYLGTIADTAVSAYPSLNPSDIQSLEFEFPDMPIQKKVASFLCNIDKRIENLRAQNRVLEQTAKTIYDYTFLQCAGHQTTYNKTLNRNIPANWEVCSIGDYIKENKGGDWGKENPEKNYNLQVSCIRGADIDKMVDLPVRYILTKNSSKLLQEFDLVVEISGGSPTQSTGRSRLITKELLEKFDNKLICSNFCQAITMKNPLYAYYISFMWKMFYDNGIFFNFEGKTSGIKNFQLDQFVETIWFFPDPKTVEKFNAQVAPLLKKQQVNTKQIETLTTQRNTLLPLLMTGQVEV